MANRTHNTLSTARTEVVQLYANLIGNTTNDMTFSTTEAANGEILTATRTNTGKHNIVFRHKYPKLRGAPIFSFVGTTDGLIGQCSAIDVAAGTASIEFYVGNTATDLATTDTVYITWSVRNSSRNE